MLCLTQGWNLGVRVIWVAWITVGGDIVEKMMRAAATAVGKSVGKKRVTHGCVRGSAPPTAMM